MDVCKQEGLELKLTGCRFKDYGPVLGVRMDQVDIRRPITFRTSMFVSQYA